MSLTEQEAADLRDIAMRVRSRHCEEGGDVGAHTVALAVAKLLDENERLQAELGIAEDLVAAGITKRDKLRAELRKLRAELAAANAQLANALNIPRPQDAAGGGWKSVNVDFDLDDDEPSQAVVSEAVAHAVADDDEPTIWEQHPAFMVLYGLYKYLECPGTVDGSDPEDRACVASASVKALMDAGILTAAESATEGPEQTRCPNCDGLDGTHTLRVCATEAKLAELDARRSSKPVSLPVGMVRKPSLDTAVLGDESTADGPEQTGEQQRPLYAVMRVLGTLGVDVRGAWHSRNQAELELDRAHRHDRSTARMPYEIYEMTKAGQATCRGSACSEGHTYESGCLLESPSDPEASSVSAQAEAGQ